MAERGLLSTPMLGGGGICPYGFVDRPAEAYLLKGRCMDRSTWALVRKHIKQQLPLAPATNTLYLDKLLSVDWSLDGLWTAVHYCSRWARVHGQCSNRAACGPSNAALTDVNNRLDLPQCHLTAHVNSPELNQGLGLLQTAQKTLPCRDATATFTGLVEQARQHGLRWGHWLLPNGRMDGCCAPCCCPCGCCCCGVPNELKLNMPPVCAGWD